MKNNLSKVEKNLRSIAKRYKSVKYSLGLAILFLMMGVNAFSEEVVAQAVPTNEQIALSRENLKNSVGGLQSKINQARTENQKVLKGLRLELIQLMEQGNQVVKSPWTSWQFGMGYTYNDWSGKYKGSGDKSEKYIYQGIYKSGNWKVKNAMDVAENMHTNGNPITPGNDNTSSWKRADNGSTGGVRIEKDNSIDSATNGNRKWGLVNLRDLREPINEVEILANVSPKEVTKSIKPINPNISEPPELPVPTVNPQVNTPLAAPTITNPEIVPPSIPSAPTINIGVTSPTITPLEVTTPSDVGTIAVNLSTVNPVDFALSPSVLSSDNARKYSDKDYNPSDWNSKTLDVDYSTMNGKYKVGNYISTWGKVRRLDEFNNITVNVKIEDTRAFMVDEGVVDSYPVGSPGGTPTTYKPFTFNGTINLEKSKNVGIDVQGTHTTYGKISGRNDSYNTIEKVANIKVINRGDIIGKAGTNNENQVGFGFNNFDTSSNNTRTEMINNGKIEIGASKSAGFQLRPESYYSDQRNKQSGLVIMSGENTGTITLNGYGSFGFLTVKNKQSGAEQVADYDNYKVKATAGGQIASRSNPNEMSYMKNSGTININSDGSVGVGLLHNIQAVQVGGIINIGTAAPTGTLANNGSDTTKVEGAIGVYSEVETRPIRGRIYARGSYGEQLFEADGVTPKVTKSYYDDHALENTEHTTTSYTYTDVHGNPITVTNYTGKTVGTETVEVSGKVEVGANAINSSGLRIKNSGSITLTGTGKVYVKGEKNYGAVTVGKLYNRYFKTEKNQYATAEADYGKINLEAGSLIEVTGKQSIGYVLKSGRGYNAGTIDVTGPSGNKATPNFAGSLGFYGEEGTFTNTSSGKIIAKGDVTHAVALVGNPSASASEVLTFTNNGLLSTTKKGNIGVYASGKYNFTHENVRGSSAAKISVGENALGIYAKGNTNGDGKLAIKAPIELANSGTGANAGTTMGIYTDGLAKVTYYNGSKITIGQSAIGMYSSDVNKFNDTFKIASGHVLEVSLGQNSTIGLLNGSMTTSLSLGKFLNNKTTDRINLTAFGQGASLFYATMGARAILDEDYTVTNGQAASTSLLVGTKGSLVEIKEAKKIITNTNVGLIATKGTGTGAASSTAKNAGIYTSTRDSALAIYADESTGENTATGTITMQNKTSVGMLGQNSSTLKNAGKIEMQKQESAGIYGKDSNITNSGLLASNKGIYAKGTKSVGLYSYLTSATTTADKTVTNSGAIKMEGSSNEKSAAIYSKLDATATKKLTTTNSGTITVEQKSSVGIFAENGTTTVANSVITNTGTINMNNEKSVGIYAPKSTVTKVGKINLADAADGSTAVYISGQGKITDTSDAEISLGTKNQNRVAYYIKGQNTTLGSATTTIGKVTGYGVGVYLEGSTGDIAKINGSTSKLHYTVATGATGNGLIGLLLKGNTEIKDYIAGIKVGDTVPKTKTDAAKYAIGIYSMGQGTSTTAYEINTSITTGANGVGLYADKDRTITGSTSNIKYKGIIEVGNKTDAGIGIFIANGKVTLDNTTKIRLNGNAGVGVIATEGTEFTANKATVQLIGSNISGVGAYGKKGSTININNWTFENNGNRAEEVRSEEGRAPIGADKSLKPKMVLSHVINGETSLASGKTVTSVDDGKYKAEENIGLMAEGIKNPTAPAPLTGWTNGNFEILNEGTINFSVAKKSTAIYVESARVKNDGAIKLGEGSTGIYGIYKASTRKYEGHPASHKNKLEVTTTANSKISLGNNSTGMYLVNAQKLDNLGGEIKSNTGATKNVGIYAINGKIDVKGTAAEKAEANAYNGNDANFNILTMNNKADITLGNGSVGIFSRGKDAAIAKRNIVTNTGSITVGKSLTGAPAVALYSENTKLDTNSTITVGENGIGFYGKNSEITAKGTANFQNKGVLAYLEKSKFVSYLGNLNATQNTMLYLKNSTANLDGKGTKVDMTVADKQTGAYIEGNSILTGIKTIQLGKNSSGLFIKNANFASQAEKITSTKEGAKGLLAINSNLTNDSKITLSGNNSIGIYSNALSTKTVKNNGELTIAGKKTLGVFLKGGQTFVNNANINIADTTSTKDDEKTIGIYTADGTTNIKHNSGNIEVGHKSIGIYSTTNSGVEMNGGKIHVKDEAIGFYKQNGTLLLKGQINVDPHTATAKNSEPVGIFAKNGANVTDSASNITVGAKSYGFILDNNSTLINRYTSTGTGNVTLGNDSVFLYSNGKAILTNRRNIASSSDRLIGFYIKGNSTAKGDLTNYATIDFSNTKGSIGIYAPGGKATNSGRVLVGKTDDIDPVTGKVYTDVSKIVYGIGMAADNGGHIINDTNGVIRVYGNKSIGMYGKGVGTTVENNGNILLDGSRATATNKIQSMTGVYVDDGATFINRGTIKTTDAYAGRKDSSGKNIVNKNVTGITGVAVMNGSTLENYGKIHIDADNSYGVVIRGKVDAKGNVTRYAVIKNYGEIKVRGKGTYGVSYKDISADDLHRLEELVNSKLTSDPKGQELRGSSGTDKSYEGVKITVKDGKPSFTRGGKPVSDKEVARITEIIGKASSNLGLSDIGFYVDTLGRTKPIDIDGTVPPINSQLIIGTEYSTLTNKKEWFVTDNAIKPFLQQIQGRNFKLTSIAGSLTWLATPVLDNHGQIKGVAMSKLPYTSFVKKAENAWNFADGLEQRYGMNALDSREKKLFNLLNTIGKNEQAVLVQAYDEMMGHQYANVQQRINATGVILDKEFKNLRAEGNASKDSNKIKTFGTRGEYNTDTAGVIDYKYNAYGVAYVHENEDIKLGRGTGWYTGIVHNTFKFKDIGNSKEQMLQAKVGLFKSVPFDDNNSLNWTISGEIFAGYNKIHRKFLVVNEIFNAKSKYYTYGIGIKNELSKEFRLSEDFSVRAFGALKLEYGRVSKIREKTGEVRLEVKHNDYISVKPEIGTELAYRHYFGTKTLRTSLGVAYENELGKLANGKNKARVVDTTADYFNVRGEKEDRRGNVKFDLNIGIDNQRVGLTGNVGYDTKGENVRGGVGLRVIF